MRIFRAQAKRMTDAAQRKLATLVHIFFINEENKDVLIVEKYTDAKVSMAHMEQFMKPDLIPKILAIQEIISIEFPGLVSSEIKHLFGQGGFSYNTYPINAK
jgi:hypothetical protein